MERERFIVESHVWSMTNDDAQFSGVLLTTWHDD